MFVRTARALDGSDRSTPLLAVVALTLLVGWGAWFVLARISVYEVSVSARLEVQTAPHPVDAPVSGRVVKSALILGRQVQPGDVVLELETDTLRLERDARRSRVTALEPQIEALKLELAEEQDALRREGVVSGLSVDEARARQRASEAMARLRANEHTQLETLSQVRAVSEIEATRMSAEAERQRAETDALGASVGRLGRERSLKRSERRAKIARIEQEVARLTGDRGHAIAEIRIHDREIERRIVRAPVGGRLGDIVAVQPGSVVEAGTRLAVIVPRGGLHAVGFFDPATSVGRVRAGQRARVRLHGFPWTNYGSLEATVDRVGNEPKDGHVRVELLLRPAPGSRIPLQHGLPGTAEVEVERVSPVALVLDSAGRFITQASQPRNHAALPVTDRP